MKPQIFLTALAAALFAGCTTTKTPLAPPTPATLPATTPASTPPKKPSPRELSFQAVESMKKGEQVVKKAEKYDEGSIDPSPITGHYRSSAIGFFRSAQDRLNRLQREWPRWNTGFVEFRLKKVQGKLKELGWAVLEPEQDPKLEPEPVQAIALTKPELPSITVTKISHAGFVPLIAEPPADEGGFPLELVGVAVLFAVVLVPIGTAKIAPK